MKIVRWIMPVALSSLAACAWWMAGRPGLEALDQLTFSHELHADEGVECDSCHDGVEGAENTSKGFLPGEDACMECHEREENCTMCHSNAEKRRARPAHVSALGFSHKNHLERIEEGCPKCHTTIATADQLPAGRPTMETCLGCHNHKEDFEAARCSQCHPTLRRLPLKAVAEFDHTGDWMARHGMMARVQGEHCLQCHTQSRCAECHSRVPAAIGVKLYPESVERSQLHRGDWLSSHPIEARADGDLCLRCHQTNSCTTCHQASGVTANSSIVRPPHRPGYAVRGGGEAFHGEDARRRIETCAACHDQGAASNCVECHKVGGIGGTPHPMGWRKWHDLKEAGKKAVCQTCHASTP